MTSLTADALSVNDAPDLLYSGWELNLLQVCFHLLGKLGCPLVGGPGLATLLVEWMILHLGPPRIGGVKLQLEDVAIGGRSVEVDTVIVVAFSPVLAGRRVEGGSRGRGSFAAGDCRALK